MKKRRDNASTTTRARQNQFALLPPDALRDAEHSDFLDMLNRSQGTIFEICILFTKRQPESIRDLYQEIAATLWESWPAFRGQSAANTWVRRVALSVAVNQFRRSAKQPPVVPLEEWMYDTIAEEASQEPPDYYRLLDGLEPSDRALVYLRLKRMSLAEMAQHLGISETAVKQRLFRLRRKLDKMKRKYDND